jgi:hypothetical protein
MKNVTTPTEPILTGIVNGRCGPQDLFPPHRLRLEAEFRVRGVIRARWSAFGASRSNGHGTLD